MYKLNILSPVKLIFASNCCKMYDFIFNETDKYSFKETY